MAGGCMVGPNYVRPGVEQPGHFKSHADSELAPAVPTEWWRLYRDPELDHLIASANESNQTLRQAVARAHEPPALARVGGSYLYPARPGKPRFPRLRTSRHC